MLQLLDRYRRLSDGKVFAILATGGASPGARDRVVAESEDGERLEGQGSSLLVVAQFERIED